MNHKRRFCPKGHDKEIVGRSGRTCAECRRERNRRYRAANIEKIRRQRSLHRAEQAARSRRWYEANKERRKQKEAERKAANPEAAQARQRARARKWYWGDHARTRELNRLAAARFYARHKEQERERVRRRKAHCEAGSVELEHLALLMDAQEGRCLYCGVPLSDTMKHLDHRLPLSRGGEHVPDNLAWACRRCNISKHDRLYPTEWTSPFIGRNQ